MTNVCKQFFLIIIYQNSFVKIQYIVITNIICLMPEPWDNPQPIQIWLISKGLDAPLVMNWHWKQFIVMDFMRCFHVALTRYAVYFSLLVSSWATHCVQISPYHLHPRLNNWCTGSSGVKQDATSRFFYAPPPLHASCTPTQEPWKCF